MRKKLGECLIQAGLVTEDDLRSALVEQKRTGERLGIVLARKNLTSEKEIAKALAFQLGFPYVDLAADPPDPTAVALIPKEVALKRACVAVRLDNNLLTMAMADPLLFSLVQDLEAQTGHRIRQVVATRADINRAIETCYAEQPFAVGGAPPAMIVGEVATAATPIGDLVNGLMQNAIADKASDVHIEPTEESVRIRHRLDGVLREVMRLPKPVHDDLIARLKAVAGMDVGETRLPQDGRLRSRARDGPAVDFRVSTLRTLFGEKVVMRVLDPRKPVPLLDEIGLPPVVLEQLRHLLRRHTGLILVAGPGRSGTTTTLSSMLGAAQSEKTNVMTVEDPIEYRMTGVNQTQVDPQVNLTFANALRSILGQDPDVIGVGEIDDAETAKLALTAARTTQLVLSAVHADAAPSAVTRLIELGAERDAIASALAAVMSQRLVRRLCRDCRREYVPTDDVLRRLDIIDAEPTSRRFYESVGCDQCGHTGYRGRIGIFELMPITERIRQLIAGHGGSDQLRSAAIADGMITMAEDGLDKVRSGATTAEELLRVVGDVRQPRMLCSSCGGAVGVDFNACPHCGAQIGGVCAHCGRGVQPGWNFCPYCTRQAGRTRAVQPRRGNLTEFKKP